MEIRTEKLVSSESILIFHKNLKNTVTYYIPRIYRLKRRKKSFLSPSNKHSLTYELITRQKQDATVQNNIFLIC